MVRLCKAVIHCSLNTCPCSVPCYRAVCHPVHWTGMSVSLSTELGCLSHCSLSWDVCFVVHWAGMFVFLSNEQRCPSPCPLCWDVGLPVHWAEITWLTHLQPVAGSCVHRSVYTRGGNSHQKNNLVLGAARSESSYQVNSILKVSLVFVEHSIELEYIVTSNSIGYHWKTETWISMLSLRSFDCRNLFQCMWNSTWLIFTISHIVFLTQGGYNGMGERLHAVTGHCCQHHWLCLNKHSLRPSAFPRSPHRVRTVVRALQWKMSFLLARGQRRLLC